MDHPIARPQIFVFGYGSLVSPGSVARTLGHEIDKDVFDQAILAGWTRRWNVGSDKESHPERTFHLDDGSEFRGLTVALGIEEDPDSRCCGAVFPVDPADLTLLDTRERNYVRIDVTDRVTWAGKPVHCVVYTYQPTDRAVERIDDARRTGRDIRVRDGYVRVVEQAFDSLGRLDTYRSTTPGPEFPVVVMSSTIDPILAPPRRSAASPSQLSNDA
jgi:cation transport regulator ChaC